MSTEESQFNVQGYNIITILKRLEAATSRLEDITIFQEEANKTTMELILSLKREPPKAELLNRQKQLPMVNHSNLHHLPLF